MRVAGIMSGTSVDAIDVAIVDISGRGGSKKVSPVAFGSIPFTSQVRKQILAVSNSEAHVATLSRLHTVLGELYAEAVVSVCAGKRVKLASV